MDPFAVLGVPPTATPAQIKSAYRSLARRAHPDAGGDEDTFRRLESAARLATEYANGTKPNPYLPDENHVLYVDHYDRHSHSPPPPANPWRNGVLGGALFWIIPVAGAIFLLSAAAGPYFLPVFVASMAVFGAVVWLVLHRQRRGG